MLRNYTGLFADEVYIDEGMLAVKLGKKRSEVYDMLIYLAKIRCVKYVPQRKTPFVVFASAREDLPFVAIPKSVYENRKKRFENRINGMLDYAGNEQYCRSKILLNYFEEDNPQECGSCDICLKKHERGLKRYEFNRIREKVLLLLQDAPLRITDLVAGVSHFEPDKVLVVVRFLVDEELLLLEEDTLSLPKTKKK